LEGEDKNCWQERIIQMIANLLQMETANTADIGKQGEVCYSRSNYWSLLNQINGCYGFTALWLDGLQILNSHITI
jgi:hypothetical protein